MEVAVLIAVVGLWGAVSSTTDKGTPETKGAVKIFYENLSSSHNQETSWNGTHTITVYTTVKNTDTNGTTTSRKETTYVINNNGVITSYTIKEP